MSQTNQSHGCVPRPAPQSCLRGNSLLQTNARALAWRKPDPQRFGRAVNQIVGARRQRSIVAGQNELGNLSNCERNRVVQTDRLHDRVELVITVRTLAEDSQTQIDFGESWKR